MKGKLLGGFLTIIFSGLLFFCGMDKKVVGSPLEAYQVYLEGEKIGVISSKNELLTLIDTEQSEIKKTYGVDKVYPPSGLDIKKIYTYDNELSSVNDIYDKIKDIEPFTIEGYNATITYTEKRVFNDSDEVEDLRPPVHIYMLDKSIFEKSLYDTATAFIGTEDLVNFEEGTQKEITDTGEKITSVYFEETMTIKKDLISTEDFIFKTQEDLSRYLLFGTLEEQSKYVIKDGEDLDSIADSHNLNIEELLIANPKYPSANVLVTAGDEINVGLIDPVVSVVYKKTVIEDVDVAYKEETIKDTTKYNDYKEVKTEGQNGLSRVTQDVKYVNGEIKQLNIVKNETLREVINKVTVVGTKSVGGGYYYYNNSQGNESWSWPTTTPFIITSRFKWRWGRQHQGIDISGCGYGSPIFAVQGGVVTYVNPTNTGASGLAINIDHGNGFITEYMHLSKIYVSVGQVVSKEQKIGAMGNSGRSTGTHLHLGVWHGGKPYAGGQVLDPCNSIFKC